MKISRVEEMRNMERRAINEFGIADELLMEHAGHAAFTVIQQTADVAGISVVICCGGGNNGGDGLVVARQLYSYGADVTIPMLVNHDK